MNHSVIKFRIVYSETQDLLTHSRKEVLSSRREERIKVNLLSFSHLLYGSYCLLWEWVSGHLQTVVFPSFVHKELTRPLNCPHYLFLSFLFFYFGISLLLVFHQGWHAICCATLSNDNYCAYWRADCRFSKKQANSFNYYSKEDHELWW